LAAAHLAGDSPDKAIQILEHALKLAPKDPDILVRLGDAWTSRNRFDKAIASYKKALEKASTPDQKAEVNACMGSAWERSGSIDKALQSYAKALESAQDASMKAGLKSKIDELSLRAKP
jgi:tetratricopeptide (TPR) repeat protein